MEEKGTTKLYEFKIKIKKLKNLLITAGDNEEEATEYSFAISSVKIPAGIAFDLKIEKNQHPIDLKNKWFAHYVVSIKFES